MLKKYLLIMLSFILPFIVFGCLESGTVVIVHDIEGFQATGSGMGSKAVDLNEEPAYADNRDRIRSIDAVSVAGQVGNLSDAPVSAQIWISDNQYTTPEEVRAHATRIFTTPTVPARDTLEIEWADGLSMIENLPELREQIEGDGQFYVYGIVSNSADIWYDLSLVITVTAGL